METEEKVMRNIIPDKEERRKAKEQFRKIKKFIKKDFGLESKLMGSIAKETFLKGDKDLDIFVFFPKNVGREQLEDKGLEIGKKVFEQFDGDYEVEYAEHPYTKGYIDNFEIEIIPAYLVDNPDDMQSSVDRTPMHTEWVNENLSREEKDQVVLLKVFLKGQNIYGSSLKTRGFAGYLCEILVARYGSFREVLKATKKWGEKQIIDVERHHEKLPKNLEKRFKNDSLIVIDPTDPERNVASVLSLENYSKFLFKSWKYLKNPSEEFFFPKTVRPNPKKIREEIKSRGEMYEIFFEKPDLTDDILYPQLRKLMRRLRDVLEENEFQLFDYGFHVGDKYVRMVLDLQLSELPGKRKHRGPKIFHNIENVMDFTSKYPNTWVSGSRLTTIVEREHKFAKDLLEDFLSGDIGEKGVPRNLVDNVQKRIIREVEVDGTDEWLLFLQKFLHMRG